MAKEKLKVGEISKPRFEFRSFGQNFDASAKRMARLSHPIPEKVWDRRSDEIYIVSQTNDVNNTNCLLYTSPSPRDQRGSRMPSSA